MGVWNMERRIYEKKKRDNHDRFLNDLSTVLLPKLFRILEINDYEVKQIFKEPRGNPPREEVSPDLVIFYKNSLDNILMVEAKVSTSLLGLHNLSEKVSYLTHFVRDKGGIESLFDILNEEVPLDILKYCHMQAAGVYKTKQGGFKIHDYKTLR
jgi:hypothetical protein